MLETANHDPKAADNNGHLSPQSTYPEPLSDTKSANQHPNIEHCAPDANIWKLYLDEIEGEEKKLVESWTAGLDSLLLFVSRLPPCESYRT